MSSLPPSARGTGAGSQPPIGAPATGPSLVGLLGDRANAAIGGLVFLIALGVYTWCLTPTVPYWDSGEFIATSYILGVPHPPGTPLYVLIGRLFTLVPLATVAERVNFLSGLSSALAVLFTYLITVRLIRRAVDGAGWLAYLGGAVAAFFMAWAPTFWESAIEAEVYGLASTIMCSCVWLALLWWDHQNEPQNDRLLWAILYVLFLAIGIHLASFLVFPCIYLLVTMVHWPRVKKTPFWWSIAVFAMALLIRLAVIVAINDQDPRITELSLAPPGTRLVANVLFLIMGAAVVWNMVAVLGARFALGIAALAVLGVSVHLYLLIRARLNPGINEADPSTWQALWLVLTRDQYKPPEPVFRKAPLLYQTGHMYLRYFGWQFRLAKVGGLPTEWLPILVGLWGAFANWRREKKSFYLMLTLFLITGPFMVWYLNFKEGEVRERDYFFVANFHFFAIWIGLGAAALVAWTSRALARGGAPPHRHPVAVGLAAFLLLTSVLPLFAGEDNQNFHRHNRRGNYVAHGYGYNFLVGLEKDAILFTNGDNDTFPLWYMQEVERFRRDVRVINLSLLQTDWYIKQLRDDPPQVPIKLTDAQIAALTPYQDQQGKIHMVDDIMVNHILQQNQWKRPVYLAATVPDQHGLEDRLKMEGLAFRIYKDKLDSTIDVPKLDENLNRLYHYRGLLRPDGSWDDSVYKDDEATKLAQNYAAARVRLAQGLSDQGRLADARAELDKVRKFAGHFEGLEVALGISYQLMGMPREALEYLEGVLKAEPGNADVWGAAGHVRLQQGDTARAVQDLKRAIELAPGRDFNPYGELMNIYRNQNDFEATVKLMENWLQYNPEDQRVRNYLNSIRGIAPRQ